MDRDAWAAVSLNEIATRPADDARERGGYPCSPNRVVPPLGEPHGFAGCWDCRHQVELDPAEMARRYGPETPFPSGEVGSSVPVAGAAEGVSPFGGVTKSIWW
jgi:hypothetical protein